MASRLREAVWLWGHEAGSHDEGWAIPARSTITPVEAAHYMGIPNVIMVRYGAATPAPTGVTAVPFRSLREVVWSIVGAGGSSAAAEIAQVLQLPRHLPNMTGVMMDDFFRRAEDGQVGVLEAEQLRQLRGQLAAAGRLRGADAAALDLWVVLYDHQLDMPVGHHLAQCDVVTFWTWEARNLERLEANAAAWQALAANSRRVLGCYMWDYGGRQPMPLDLMERQCELGRQWLRQGRIHGLIFLASCICDLELEAVEWTRRWLQAVGDEPLP